MAAVATHVFCDRKDSVMYCNELNYNGKIKQCDQQQGCKRHFILIHYKITQSAAIKG